MVAVTLYIAAFVFSALLELRAARRRFRICDPPMVHVWPARQRGNRCTCGAFEWVRCWYRGLRRWMPRAV
jgi:hypothetical protein